MVVTHTKCELLFKGCAIADIADVIEFHRSSIYRELNRNSGQSGCRITQNFNDSPMRCLGYQTPKEVFFKGFWEAITLSNLSHLEFDTTVAVEHRYKH